VDYRILFTQRALADFAEIIGYIAEDDDEAVFVLAVPCSIMWNC
jgi:hypothetical protein